MLYAYLEIFLKLVLSGVLGAMIGFERENKNRPAGLRTNILVCVGSALVQITNIDIFNQYHAIASIDPARFGADVNIKRIEFKENEGEKLEVYLSLKLPTNINRQELMAMLMKEDGIYSIEEVQQ